MLGRFNYLSDRQYVDVPGDPKARESRCASKFGPTAKIQKLLNDSFSDLVGIGMGHEIYFLHLLRPMSCKKEQR